MTIGERAEDVFYVAGRSPAGRSRGAQAAAGAAGGSA